jgi:hypothetical protein
MFLWSREFQETAWREGLKNGATVIHVQNPVCVTGCSGFSDETSGLRSVEV